MVLGPVVPRVYVHGTLTPPQPVLVGGPPAKRSFSSANDNKERVLWSDTVIGKPRKELVEGIVVSGELLGRSRVRRGRKRAKEKNAYRVRRKYMSTPRAHRLRAWRRHRRASGMQRCRQIRENR